MLHFRRCIPAISVRATRNYTAAWFASRVMREADSIASFMYIRDFQHFQHRGRKEGRAKNIRGAPIFSRKGPPPSRFFIPSFLPSFLPWCDMRPRGVYFLRLLYAHSIILYSFLHLTPWISLTSPTRHIRVSGASPPIFRAYAILHGTCKFNFPAHPHVPRPVRVPAPSSPTLVSLSPSSYRFRRFEIQTPGDW